MSTFKVKDKVQALDEQAGIYWPAEVVAVRGKAVTIRWNGGHGKATVKSDKVREVEAIPDAYKANGKNRAILYKRGGVSLFRHLQQLQKDDLVVYVLPHNVVTGVRTTLTVDINDPYRCEVSKHLLCTLGRKKEKKKMVLLSYG